METDNPYRSPQPETGAEAYVVSDIFRGTTLSWFVDRYEFFVPEMVDVLSTTIAFYEATNARVVARDPLTFWRGNLWSTLLGPERYARQRIVVHTDDQQHRVWIEYHINMVLPTRMYYSSHREVIRLATELGATHRSAIA
ncbi:hypothetical protein [Blastopirellula marina]|uniref:Uncharacterized protein n=1 Tax=Blastopirellula marina TaxID=124 RepID=A0A2S8FM99_9BACT|nr:hypothetical protein [Blastopirellula marina]PQO32974.1 hypothetical protein C5Y98_17710 [Blastopirellula marina]PTL43141.1 hypothetical protein C5Y97_17720 [Blastopirellula marina]